MVEENNTGLDEQSTTVSEEQTSATTNAINPADLVETRGATVDEALEMYKNMSGGKAELARIAKARAEGREESAARAEEQMRQTAISIAKQTTVAVDTTTGEVIDSVRNSWADRPAIGGADKYLKSKNVPDLYLKKESERILSGSNSFLTDEVVSYESTDGGVRAIFQSGKKGPGRATEEEARQSAIDHFGIGQKVAETSEQAAALVKMTVQYSQFGGQEANSNKITNLLQRALPSVNRNEVWKFGNGIQNPIKIDRKTGEAYTTYGSGLTIGVDAVEGEKRLGIFSPEGKRIGSFTGSPHSMILYGLSKEAILAGMDLAQAEGIEVNPTLSYFLSNDADPAAVRNFSLYNNQAEVLKETARRNLYAGEGDLAARWEEGGKDGFVPDPLDTTDIRIQLNNYKSKWFKDNYSGPTTLTLEEYVAAGSPVVEGLPEGLVDMGDGLYALGQNPRALEGQFSSFFDEQGVMKSDYDFAEKQTLEYSLYNIVGLASSTSDPAAATEYTLPTWSLDSYVQKLNDIYKTPNNNIQLSSNGLEYRYADGSSTTWGRNIENLNAFPVMLGTAPAGGRQGEIFSTAQQFNSAEEYQLWKQNRDKEGQVTAAQTQAPTVPSATDDLEATSETTTEPDTSGVPSYVGAQTTDTGATQAVAPDTPAPQQPTTPSTGLPTYPTATIAGTFGTPLQTAGLSSVPTYQQQTPQQQAGFTSQQLTSTMPSTGESNIGVKTVTYANQFGQTMPVTETNGTPVTFVPPGFTKQSGAAKGGYMTKGYAEGGMTGSEDAMLEAKYRIATMNGYNGPKTNEALNTFANASEGMKRKFNAIGTVMANKGGYMTKGYANGGLSTDDLAKMQASAVQQTMQPMQSAVSQIQPQEQDFIPTTAGQTAAAAPMAEAATLSSVQQAQMPVMATPAYMAPTTAAPAVQQETAQLQAAQGTVAPQAQLTAAQQQASSVTGMQAAQGQAILMDNPVQREIQAGELISGAADAQKAAAFTEQVQAATATPSAQATVQGQLESLMQQFEGGETPAWAAGSMRTAMANLSARGLGASSMAGQAVIQATMEAALPIAQIDAQTQAQFEAQNLSNRQQRAMLAAQQRATFLGMEFDQAFQARVANSSRIGDVANMNFTAEQNIALENSRAANTVNLNNLSNRQATVMAEAAALANLDMANLNNRQQAAVQNAQSFLQMDMANLSNEQQTAMFKSQQNIQALFTDQAAANAASQFNAASENQTNQFFANLTSQTSQFNASQQNAMDQFNVNSVNALREFNSEIQQQRDMFNAQNGLVIAQANAQWRQNIATMNNAAQNESNAEFARTMNSLTSSNMDQIWQRERDIMSFAFAASESAADRNAQIALAKLTADEQAALADNIGKGKLFAMGADKLLDKWLG